MSFRKLDELLEVPEFLKNALALLGNRDYVSNLFALYFKYYLPKVLFLTCVKLFFLILKTLVSKLFVPFFKDFKPKDLLGRVSNFFALILRRRLKFSIHKIRNS